MSDIAVQLVDPEDNSQNQYPRTLAQLVATANGSDVETELGGKKTKQTAVPNPNVDGSGVDFVDSVTQNTNGDITPHRKSVREATEDQSGLITAEMYKYVESTKSNAIAMTTGTSLSSYVNQFFGQEAEELKKKRNVLFVNPDGAVGYDDSNPDIYYYYVDLRIGNTIYRATGSQAKVPFRLYVSFLGDNSKSHRIRFIFQNQVGILYIFNLQGSYNSSSGDEYYDTEMRKQYAGNNNSFINVGFEITNIGYVNNRQIIFITSI